MNIRHNKQDFILLYFVVKSSSISKSKMFPSFISMHTLQNDLIVFRSVIHKTHTSQPCLQHVLLKNTAKKNKTLL